MMDIKSIISDSNFLNVYPFGSRVYSTNSERSDYDYICVVKDKISSLLVDDAGNHYHLFTVSEFQYALNISDIQTLECYFLPRGKVIKYEHEFKIILNKNNLRTSISTITSNSWVKGKKKLIVTGDYDKYLGIKSVFHSLRILDFGIQISRYNSIKDYSCLSYIWFDILKISTVLDRNELWEALDSYLKSM